MKALEGVRGLPRKWVVGLTVEEPSSGSSSPSPSADPSLSLFLCFLFVKWGSYVNWSFWQVLTKKWFCKPCEAEAKKATQNFLAIIQTSACSQVVASGILHRTGAGETDFSVRLLAGAQLPGTCGWMNHSSCGQLALAESVQNLRGEQESGPGHTEEATGVRGGKSSSGLYSVWKLRPGCWGCGLGSRVRRGSKERAASAGGVGSQALASRWLILAIVKVEKRILPDTCALAASSLGL